MRWILLWILDVRAGHIKQVRAWVYHTNSLPNATSLFIGRRASQIASTTAFHFGLCDWKKNENEKNELLRHHGLAYLKKNVNCGIASTLYSGL